LLAYDHLLTLSGEIHFVWNRKFSGATVLFVLNRYVNLFSKIVLPISTFWWPNQTDKHTSLLQVRLLNCIGSCRRIEYATVFSALRVYAIWNQDWRPLVVVLLIGISIPVTNMVISFVTHSFAIAVDLLVLALTWIKTYEIKRLSRGLQSNATFSALILRDGELVGMQCPARRLLTSHTLVQEHSTSGAFDVNH
ncbi:hypothetical protein PYCCODRAFT_1363009, partial [Trametes coccinea BRFM310]